MSVAFRKQRNSWQYRFMLRGKQFTGAYKTEDEAKEAEIAAREKAEEMVVKTQKADLSHIHKELGLPDVFARFSDFACPCVYMIVRWKDPIYIGHSSCGVTRPFDSRHHWREQFRSSDTVLTWRCQSVEAAKKLESEMIQHFRPVLNVAGLPERQNDRARRLFAIAQKVTVPATKSA